MEQIIKDGSLDSGHYLKDSGDSDENNFEPEGANPTLPGFTKSNLNRHYRDHGGQYPGLTKQQYQLKALDLVRAPVGGDIVGYKAKDGAIVRYNTATNDFTKSYSTGMATLYKPDDGIAYYERDKSRRG
jgi:pyocin large subunit-like protein